MATEPRLLLLDEPLAALDVATRGEVRRDLRRHLTTFDGTRIMVTHDPVDAYALADRVVILEGGRVAQTGTLAEVSARPRSHYIAELVGANLLLGQGDAGVFTTASGGRIVPGTPSRARIRAHPAAVGRARTGRRPTAARATCGRRRWPTSTAGPTVCACASMAAVPLVAEITPAALDALVLRPGDELWATVKATEITAYPR